MLDTALVPGCGNAEIDAFCLKANASLVYSSSGYVGLVSAETSSQPYWIVSREEGRIVSALPLLVRSGSLGPVVNSLAYYGSNGGIITHGESRHAKLAALEAYRAFCERIGAVASTLITNPLLRDSDFYARHLPHDLRDERIGQVTFFPEDADAVSLMRRFAEPRPRNIRKAQRDGIAVERSQAPEALAFVHATHHQNLCSIGGLPKRAAFFAAVPEHLPPDGWQVFLAVRGGDWIAALLLLYFNGTVEYYTPCVVQSHRSSQALSLLIYQAMLDAMRRGFTRWNWGGTWLTQSGVYSFKKKWGTTDLPYFYFTRVYDPAVAHATREQLLAEYPGFFVLPFAALGGKGRRSA